MALCQFLYLRQRACDLRSGVQGFFWEVGLGLGSTRHPEPVAPGQVTRKGISCERTFGNMSDPADLQAMVRASPSIGPEQQRGHHSVDLSWMVASAGSAWGAILIPHETCMLIAVIHQAVPGVAWHGINICQPPHSSPAYPASCLLQGVCNCMSGTLLLSMLVYLPVLWLTSIALPHAVPCSLSSSLTT